MDLNQFVAEWWPKIQQLLMLLGIGGIGWAAAPTAKALWNSKPLGGKLEPELGDGPVKPPEGVAEYLTQVRLASPNADYHIWWVYALDEKTIHQITADESKLAVSPADRNVVEEKLNEA